MPHRQPAVVTASVGIAPERLASLDAFRGLTIAAMILVNNPGTWRQTHPWLQHAEWHGWAFADLIFPAFLFIAGAAIPLSLEPALARGVSGRRLFIKVLRRTAILFAMGLFLNGFPLFDWTEIRIPGVLQRIALCYGAAAGASLALRVRGQALAAAACLAFYWSLMLWLPWSDHVAGDLSPEGNLAARVDHALLAHHLLHLRWDPEGLLSTLPALASTLAGVLTGHWLRTQRSPTVRLAGLCAAGMVAIAVGLTMRRWFPINKNLWSPSYAVFTTGTSMALFALCFWLIDHRGTRAWTTPLVVYGRNPLLAYFLSTLADKGLLLVRVARPNGSHPTLKRAIFEQVFLPLAGRSQASLLYAAACVVFWLGVMAILYRRRIFVKI